MADEKDEKQQSREQELLHTMRERFQRCVEAESDQRSKSLDDLEFMCEENQWPKRAQIERQASGRPTLVVNRIDQFVQHITNGMRQNRVSSRVWPVDDKSDPETAKIIQGLIRNIEYQSNADLAYDTAAFYAVACGFGYYDLDAEYSDPKSFDQELRLRRVKNPFTRYLDPDCDDPTGADAEYGFKVLDYTKDEFVAEYPDSELGSASDFQSIGDSAPGWITKDGCRVVKYYYKDYRKDTLYRVKADGVVIDVLASELKGAKPPAASIVAERETRIPTAYYIKSNGIEILEKKELAAPRVPIFRIIGAELNVDGKTILKGIIRNLKDAQRQYNYMLTAQTEAAMDNGEIVGIEGQFEGHEQEWQNRIRKRQAFVQIKGTTVAGQPAPMPSRIPPDPSLQWKTEARLMAADDLKALTGIYDSALGARSNETSGKAIFQRQQQSETANFHFEDNKTRAITASTKLIVDLIPTYYDTQRTLRIVGEDDAQRMVKVNQQWQDNGKDVLYDLTVGKYDVVCTSGPSFATKRIEGANALTQLAQSAPIIMNAAPDIVMKCMDIPYAQEIAERLKKTLPPGLADDDKEQQIPAQAQQIIQQKSQEAQQLNAHCQQLEQQLAELQRKIDGKVIENEGRMQLAELQERTKIVVAEINAKAQETQTRMAMEREQWLALHGSAHEYAMQKDQQEASSQAAQQAADNAAQQQQMAAEQDGAQAAQ